MMRIATLTLLSASVAPAFVSRTLPTQRQHAVPRVARASPTMAANVDLKGKVAFVAGVADSNGYGE